MADMHPIDTHKNPAGPFPASTSTGLAHQQHVPWENDIYRNQDRVRPEQIRQGVILRLPPLLEIELKHWSIDGDAETTVEEFCGNGENTCSGWLYNHPVLIVSRPVHEPDFAYFCRKTTLGGVSLTDKFKRGDPSELRYFLPVHPSKKHPWKEYATLHLARGAVMPAYARGYVKVNKVFRVPVKYLARFYLKNQDAHPETWELDQRSFEHVLGHLKKLIHFTPFKHQYHATPEDWGRGAQMILDNANYLKRKKPDSHSLQEDHPDKILRAVWTAIDRFEFAEHLGHGPNGNCSRPPGTCPDIPTMCHYFREITADPTLTALQRETV